MGEYFTSVVLINLAARLPNDILQILQNDFPPTVFFLSAPSHHQFIREFYSPMKNKSWNVDIFLNVNKDPKLYPSKELRRKRAETILNANQ